MFKLMILIGTLFLIVFASKGFDFEYRIDYGEMICFRQSGYDFFVQRYDAQYPSGHYKNNLDAALKNNLKTDLAYIPCRKLDIYTQVNNLFKNVGPTYYNRVWIVINQHRTISCSIANSCDYVKDLVNQLQQKNKTVGIKTSFNYFQSAMGWDNNCSQLSVLPLWYEEMDYTPSFNNFRQFNNWTQPSRKQYRGLSGCSARGGTEDYQS